MSTFLSLLLLVVVPLGVPTAASAEAWRRYTNDRFGTSVEIPAYFRAQPAPANDDGGTFVSSDGSSRILVYGSYAPSVVVETFAAYRSWSKEETLKEGYTVSYDAAGKDWFALSGSKGDRIIYVKVIAACPDHSLAHHVSIEYPAAEKDCYDAVVRRLSRSLRPVGNAGC
jgi:hypothetical protein